MIPELIDGVLPAGVHECTMGEVDERFGRVQQSDRRVRLTGRARACVPEARRSGIVVALVIDGSYVTAMPEPDDIDLVIALRPGLDQSGDLRPFEYNVVSRRMVKDLYGFDVFPAEGQSARYQELIEFFSRV